MTLYRDVDDTFVTSTYDFTSDVEAFRSALSNVVADGGGDYAEALDEGLAESLAAPAWRDPSSTIQLIFLVADAPPQVGRQLQGDGYPDSIVDAVSRGIKIFPVASSESDDQAEAVFRQLAQATGARFVFLSYGAGGAATGGSTDIDPTDYEELSLDDLVVRLVTEELAALTGDETQVPPPPSTTVDHHHPRRPVTPENPRSVCFRLPRAASEADRSAGLGGVRPCRGATTGRAARRRPGPRPRRAPSAR